MGAFVDNMRAEVQKLELELSVTKSELESVNSKYEKTKSLLLVANELLKESVCPTNVPQIEWMGRRAALYLESRNLN